MANLPNDNVVDNPDTLGNNSVSRTPLRVTPLVWQDKTFFFKPAELYLLSLKAIANQPLPLQATKQEATKLMRNRNLITVRHEHFMRYAACAQAKALAASRNACNFANKFAKIIRNNQHAGKEQSRLFWSSQLKLHVF